MGQNGCTNPAPLWKCTMKLLGVNAAGISRRPLTPGTAAGVAEVRKALVDFGWL